MTVDKGSLERLAAEREIADLKARYFRCMDTRDWRGMADVFTADAVMDMRAEIECLAQAGLPVELEGGLLKGREAIIAAMSRSLEGIVTVHHGHMPELEIQSTNEARGIWSMEDILRFPEGAPIRELHGYGHYHETYVRERDGRWRIASLRFSRLHVDLR